MDNAVRAELDDLKEQIGSLQGTYTFLAKGLEIHREDKRRAVVMLERALESLGQGLPELAANQVRAAIAELRPKESEAGDSGEAATT